MSVSEKKPENRTTSRVVVFGLLPLIALGLVIFAFVRTDPLEGVREAFPPVEELTFERVTLKSDPQDIVVKVRNGGPDPVKIAQVLVDDAYWQFTVSPDAEVGRLGAATLHVPYPWVDGETHHLVLVSSSGVKFEHEIAVAVETPEVDTSALWTFTLVGIFVGVIPVFLGLCWLPFVRRLPEQWVGFFLALTAGLLVFLAVDAIDEALEISGGVAGAFQGVGLIVLGFIAALAVLWGVDGWLRQRRTEMTASYVAALIAIGIGLHNLGEGLAIGAAYSLGEVGLTTFLILGFTLHNITEGLGIVTPLARARPSIRQLILLGVVAGVPTIFGTWFGGLAYSPVLAVLFLAIGAGAIVQVIWEVGKLLAKQGKGITSPLNALGFTAGVLVMYLTGLFVSA